MKPLRRRSARLAAFVSTVEERARAAQKLLIGRGSHLYVYTAPTTDDGRDRLGPEGRDSAPDIDNGGSTIGSKGLKQGLGRSRLCLFDDGGEHVREETSGRSTHPFHAYYLQQRRLGHTLQGRCTLSKCRRSRAAGWLCVRPA